MIECSKCKQDTRKQVVLERKPLKDISDQLPDHLKHDYKEFMCQNKIKSLLRQGFRADGKVNYQWFEETCNNHILARKKHSQINAKRQAREVELA